MKIAVLCCLGGWQRKKMLDSIKKLAGAIALAKSNSAKAEKAKEEVRNLWDNLPYTPDYLPLFIPEIGWGYVVTPNSCLGDGWLKWIPDHWRECDCGPDECSACEKAEQQIHYISVEEFLGALVGYYRKIAQEKSDQVTARNNLARGLRSALANK